jgi:hypothetical protein
MKHGPASAPRLRPLPRQLRSVGASVADEGIDVFPEGVVVPDLAAFVHTGDRNRTLVGQNVVENVS